MKKTQVGKKQLYQLAPGDCFTALITDITQGQITILLADGGYFTARTLIPPQAHIGEESMFLVKENNGNGLIKLEFVKPGGDSDKRMLFDMRV